MIVKPTLKAAKMSSRENITSTAFPPTAGFAAPPKPAKGTFLRTACKWLVKVPHFQDASSIASPVTSNQHERRYLEVGVGALVVVEVATRSNEFVRGDDGCGHC